MLRSYLSFCLSLFKSHTQLHLEILFLRKQLEIVTRTSPKLRLRPSDRFFMGILTDLFDSWKEALLIFKPETVIRWHRQSFRVFWKWKSRSTPGHQFLKPRSTLSSRWQTTTLCGVLRGFTARCSNSGLISQKPPCSDICPGDLKEQPGSAGRRS
jgi:hypothetical protein